MEAAAPRSCGWLAASLAAFALVSLTARAARPPNRHVAAFVAVNAG
jgi:hypothetical protein